MGIPVLRVQTEGLVIYIGKTSGATRAPLVNRFEKWCPFGMGVAVFFSYVFLMFRISGNSSTRGAELLTSKQLLRGSYFGSLFSQCTVW